MASCQTWFYILLKLAREFIIKQRRHSRRVSTAINQERVWCHVRSDVGKWFFAANSWLNLQLRVCNIPAVRGDSLKLKGEIKCELSYFESVISVLDSATLI